MRRHHAPAVAALAALASLLILTGCRRDDPRSLGLELLPADDGPCVAVRFLLEVGSAFDPPGKEGLCRLAWTLLADGGSRSRSSGQIAEALAPFGTELRLEVGREASGFSAIVLREDLDAFYAVLREMLLEPGFREIDFERLKEAQIGLLREFLAGGREDQLAGEILAGMIHEGMAGSHPAEGWLDSVSSITLDEVRDFHREHFVRGNIIIGLAGGYPAGFPDRIREDFLSLPATFTPKLPARAARRLTESRALLVERPGKPAAVAFGLPLPLTPADDDFHALQIAAIYLAESDTDAAVGALAPGLESPDGFDLPVRRRAFSLVFRSAQGLESADLAGRAAAHIRALAEEGLTQERFAQIRDGLLRSLGLRGRSVADRLARRMAARALGQEDALAAAAHILPGLSAEDVRNAVRRHLPLDRFCFAVVSSDAAAWSAALASGGGALRLRPEVLRVLPAAEWIRAGEAAAVDGGKPDRLE